MAESIVQVTEGTGKKLHTFNRVIGANTVEDEVVVNGEPYLASYTVTHGPASTATAASHITQIMAGASLRVRIRRIEVHQAGAVTAAAIGLFSLVRLTTAGTGGTALTPAPMDTSDAASGATAMTLPTVKGTESTQITLGAAYMMQTIGASTPLANPIYVVDFDRPRSKPLILQAGATIGVALKCITALAAGTVTVQWWLDETSFA